MKPAFALGTQSRGRIPAPAVLALLLLAPGQSATAAPIEEIVVSTARLPPIADDGRYVTRLDASALAASPHARLDAALTAVPGVSLFRRTSSLVAHPTTQGLTLRGIGPNGAGRALVLLDGIPLNDPFGGWVVWSAIDMASLAAVEIRRGSGGGAFGNQALTGTLSLETRRPADAELRLSGRLDSDDTVDVSGAVGGRLGRTALLFTGSHFDSDGYILLPPDQRGPVDVPAASRASHAALLGETALGAHTTLVSRLAWFGEHRRNGTPLAGNATDGLDASLRLVVDHGRTGPGLTLALYATDRDFSNLFTAIDEDRRNERPVLDQFAVPSRAAGASASLRWPLFRADLLEIGADWRRLEGTTNERFRNLGDGFTRLRRAGGDERFAGLWLDYAGQLTRSLGWQGGVRLDRWWAFNGVRRESELATGAALRDDAISDRAGTLVNGHLGLHARVGATASLRLAAYSGFRLPTINEFYRPFRVGNDITEANPGLNPERLYGFEAGVRYAPRDGVWLEANVFHNRLAKAVGNVTLAVGPGFFPPTGFVPAGGSLRQRHNIDRIRARGIENEISLSPFPGVTTAIRYLLVDARVRRNDAAPALIGKRLAQSPRHTLAFSLGYEPHPELGIRLSGRHVSSQFEDDLNSRRLPAFTTLDLALDWRFTPHMRFDLAVENLFDVTILSRVDGSGLAARAAPRRLSIGLHYVL
ncbi:MAG: TonB-dependent receptor [Rhodothalassiaceae bacterium]